jgi:RNA polymerase sigma-70 factor (ECF subfamily)
VLGTLVAYVRRCRLGDAWLDLSTSDGSYIGVAGKDDGGVDMGSIVAMVPADSGVEQPPTAMPRLDPDSAEWLQMLAGTGPAREATLARLHEMLVRIARGEVGRRAPRLQLTGPELDDLAYQAAADALIAITGKLGQFRGGSRFTTWAYKFVIFEVSAKIGRHFWRHPDVRLDAEDWDRLPARFGFDPVQEAEWRDLLAALRRAVDEELTARQRRVFVAIVLNGVPLDALVIELASNRNAIYKTLFDARRKLRAALAANGYVCDA